MNPVLIEIIRISLVAFAERVAVFVALLMQFGLACWCMYQPDPMRLATMGLFGVIVFLPVLSKYYPKHEPKTAPAPAE